MHFTIQREALLKPLQLVAGVVERKHTMPVLSNVLLVLQDQQLSMTGTDTEVELIGRVTLEEPAQDGEVTVPARKLMDICKNLPPESTLSIRLDEQRLLITSGRSRFTLTTLPASDFPIFQEITGSFAFRINQGNLRFLIERTSFAMAQQDVRYFLNGLMLEATTNKLRAVATDGHRLALSDVEAEISETSAHQVIVPRKGVLELARLMDDESAFADITLSQTFIRASTEDFIFTSKLIDGKFPDYERVLPRGGDKIITVDRVSLRDSLNRASILTNEKYRGIRLQFENELLKLQANNPEQESAEEEVVIDYNGPSLEMGFNVNYLQDILNVMSTSQAKLTLSDENSSLLMSEAGNESSAYVVMPMRL
ncbi:MAG: DNA polymerase III subunit beta [Thiopseudomonas sp.]|nr:DNA polymerase III subunit beta [Thiopseudomonas sp.]MCK9464518.1 DNA polymerase III subunit beta [Thiopseudomonas sp.]